MNYPRIIQGGMGIGLSDWRLARAVSAAGGLGTVSGAGIWMVMTRRLQDGDPGGHVRRALAHFPVSSIADTIVRRYFVEGGRRPSRPYRLTPMLTHPLKSAMAALLVAASFVEVWLAKEGHAGVVAVNYLEKIQLAHLPSIYGAMLAGVDVVIMGAGIPHQVPGVLDALAAGEPASYRIAVTGDATGATVDARFAPGSLGHEVTPLRRPRFFPIVSSHVLAGMLLKRSTGRVDGFIVEGPTAAGHSAPPRARRRTDMSAPPAYGPEDDADLAAFREIGLPFWIAGSHGGRDALALAREQGAHGIQAGSIFALCAESALRSDLKVTAIERALRGELTVTTNFISSPTGFPFKEAQIDGTLTDDDIYGVRGRRCDLGVLRTPVRTATGSIAYRCSAEPPEAFVAKGGDIERTVGARCLCNALLATIGRPQSRPEGIEPPLLTLGGDLGFLHELASPRAYSASDAVAHLLGDSSSVDGNKSAPNGN